MNEHDFLLSVGGQPSYQVAMDGSDTVEWNFGLLPPTAEVMADRPPTLYEAFPAIRGKWDGKTTVNHHEAVRRVLGRDLKAHYQEGGMCGGHAGSRTLELLQCVLIATGKRATYKDVSHAWPYALARKDGGMLGPGDGVPGGSIPPVLEKYGALFREEAGDPSQGGRGCDDVARKWGGRGGPPEAMYALAKDNLVTARVRVKSAEELADGLAAGGIACCSDGQGYTMQRDANGFCQPRGTWWHYHTRSGVRLAANGQPGFQYDQSWSDETPSGSLVPGAPGNVFLVPYDVQDRLCRSGEVDILLGFQLWELKDDLIPVLPWLI